MLNGKAWLLRAVRLPERNRFVANNSITSIDDQPSCVKSFCENREVLTKKLSDFIERKFNF